MQGANVIKHVGFVEGHTQEKYEEIESEHHLEVKENWTKAYLQESCQ